MLNLIIKCFRLPPRLLFLKALNKLMSAKLRFYDWKKSSYSSELHRRGFNSIIRHDKKSLLIGSKLSDTDTNEIINNYLSHRFDILGSGWVRVFHGMECLGLEGYRYHEVRSASVDCQGRWLIGRINKNNLCHSQEIWKLIDHDYSPIDWHIDFKSGHRWLEKLWFKDIRFGHKLGVDIKVPWELARLQHLPQLALYYHSQSSDKEKRDVLSREYRNQVLDFIATNPPRFGVNWVCPMDVSIRAANLILSFNLFSASEAEFDENFKTIFINSIYDHGLHIVQNLEWYDHKRGNHYLADISGLLFISSFLHSSFETDAWLAFAIQELVREVEYQFYPDGGNFECSTAYHRLSAEMVIFATALVLGIPTKRLRKLRHDDLAKYNFGRGKPNLKKPPLTLYKLPVGSTGQHNVSPFPAWYFERLERMVEFIMDITKPNGNIIQIGDNDSGRFFKLNPCYEKMKVREAKSKFINLKGFFESENNLDCFVENPLNCAHLVAAAYSLFQRSDFSSWLGDEICIFSIPDAVIIRELSKNIGSIGSQRYLRRSAKKNKCFNIGELYNWDKRNEEVIELERKKLIEKVTFPLKNNFAIKYIGMKYYPDFGIYLISFPNFFMSVRVWQGPNPNNIVHMHHDQFSIELILDGEELFRDPGTYLYTPLPQKRNEYRSGKAHFPTCFIFEEIITSKSDVFIFPKPVIGHVNHFFYNGNNVIFDACANNINLIILLNETELTIYWTNTYESKEHKALPFSIGYGQMFKR